MKKYWIPLLFGIMGLFMTVFALKSYNDGIQGNWILIIGIGLLLMMISVHMFVKRMKRRIETVREEVERSNYKIRFHKYSKAIYVVDMDEVMISGLIESHEEIDDGFHRLNDFVILQSSYRPNVLVVKCPSDIDFYEFHNLVAWLCGTGEHSFKEIYGMASMHEDEQQSYYVKLDATESMGDQLVGAMKNGSQFTIYLPEAYVEGGNITLVNRRFDIPEYTKVVEAVKG